WRRPRMGVRRSLVTRGGGPPRWTSGWPLDRAGGLGQTCAGSLDSNDFLPRLKAGDSRLPHQGFRVGSCFLLPWNAWLRHISPRCASVPGRTVTESEYDSVAWTQQAGYG